MENPENKQENNPPAQKPSPDKNLVKTMAFEMAMEFAFIIGIPIFALVYAGKWYDTRHHTKYFVIIGFFIALALSSYIIGKKINKIRKGLK
jgi:hypothetical protein